MEIVNENETVAVAQKHMSLEEERARMQRNVMRATSLSAAQMATARNQLRPPPSVPRHDSRSGGVRLPASRPSAPTKSTDAAASMRSTQRANSSKALLRANSLQRRAPIRTSSMDSTNSLRAFRKDQIANSVAERSDSFRVGRKDSFRSKGPSATLGRQESSQSIMTTGTNDMSVFSMDSVNLRKSQMVADPLDNCTYNEEDSSADHDTISRASGIREAHDGGLTTIGGPPPRRGLDKFFADDINISTRSFGTIASGLTTGFTEHDMEDLSDEDEDDEDMED